MWNNTLIFFISFFVLVSFLHGLKIGYAFLSGARISSKDKSSLYPRLQEKIFDRSGRSRKILAFIVFFVLALCFYIFTENIIFSLFISACPGIYIMDFLNSFEEKKKDILHTQIVEFLNNMIVMLKAGNTIRYIFKSSSGCFESPLGDYLREAARELELNFTLDEAMDRFSERCKSKEVGLLVSSLKINNKIGGDLIPVLDNVADSIRNNVKLKSRIRTMNIQSRISANIISIFPVLVLILMCVFLDDSILDFFSTGIGIVFLIAGGIMEIAGIIIIKRITGFKNYV
jgi:tight adherence protein B